MLIIKKTLNNGLTMETRGTKCLSFDLNKIFRNQFRFLFLRFPLVWKFDILFFFLPWSWLCSLLWLYLLLTFYTFFVIKFHKMYQLFNSQHFFSFLFNKFQIKEAIYLYVCVHTLKHTHTHTHTHTYCIKTCWKETNKVLSREFCES